MTDRPKVNVVILNRNNAPDTIACLASLSQSTYPNVQCVVVDNASDDNSASRIAANFPAAKMLINSHNLGFAGGMNVGIRNTCEDSADYALLINNDTIVDPAAVSEMVEAAERRPEIGICVPKIYYYQEANRIWSAGARWRRFPPRVTMIGLGQIDQGNFDLPADLDYATGCALLIRRAVLERVGGFDEGFFMYQEDYDYCDRVHADRWIIHYVPAAKVWHKVSAGLGSRSSAWWYWWGRSTLRLYLHTWQYSWAEFLPVLAWFIARELLKKHIRFIRPMLAGMRDEFGALRQNS